MNGLDGAASVAAEWGLTYAIHSTLLLSLAALLTYRLVGRDAWRETLWRAALLGSILTATIAVASPLPRPGGSMTLELERPDMEPVTGSQQEEAAGGDRLSTPRPQAQPVGKEASMAAAARFGWSESALTVWLAVAILLLAILGRRNLRVMKRLKHRERVEDRGLLAMLAELRRNAGVWRSVRLSVSPSCPTPLVLGLSEICVPPRFIVDLGEEEQRAALAHELAHIRRRDPQWQLATGILNALLFFQPLNLLARMRLAESSEHLCDDWAVRLTGSALPLGRCLAEIASWTSVDSLSRLHGTPAMAEGGSGLLQRIRRITSGVAAPARVGLVPSLGVGLVLLATAGAAPVVRSTDQAPAALRSTGGVKAAGPERSLQDLLIAVAAQEELAMEAPSARIREEATSQLSDFQHPAAAQALMRLIRRATDSEVRRTAAAQLDEFPTDGVVAVLLEAVFADAEAAVQQEALATLEDFRSESADRALRRVAQEHPVESMRGAALSALSDPG